MNPILLKNQKIKKSILEQDGPIYFYDFEKIEYQFNELKKFLPDNFKVHYTLKANSNLAICNHLAQLGASADISSVGELVAAIKAGFKAKNMVFTGPGKTNKELLFALNQGINLIVVESVNEAYRLNSIAQKEGKFQDILVRINPLYRTSNSCEVSQGVNNCSINTDLNAPVQLISENASKFGIDEQIASEAIKEIASLGNINLKGIHVFTESNLIAPQQLIASCQNTINIANSLQDQGFPISIVDFGGGMGVPYNNVDPEFDLKAFGEQMYLISDRNTYQYQYVFELGRYLVCESGSYVTEVVDIKVSQGKKFFILDGGVHQLLRTSMKKANKFMDVIGKETINTEKVTFAGKLPTPLDIMVEDVTVPDNVEIGDRIIIYNCGAYGFNHSLTNFALHNYPAEIAHNKGQIEVIREPGMVEDFFLNQQLPYCFQFREKVSDFYLKEIFKMKQVSFTAMADGSKEDIVLLYALADDATQDTPERILRALEPLKNTFEGYQISRYEHSLQAATRAYRHGESEETIVAALLHDIGDFLAPYNAAEMAAAILKPYVSEKTYWIVKHHAIFQKYYCAHYLGGDRFAREKYQDSPYYQATIDFCERYDQNSFDPNYDTLPLEFFEPIVNQVFAQPQAPYQFIPKLEVQEHKT